MKIKSILIPAAVAALCFIAVFLFTDRLPFIGNKTFIRSDEFVQHICLNRLLWDNILSGQGAGYTFRLGMGTEMLPVFAFVSFSPVNVVYAFVRDENAAAFLTALLKCAASASFFYFFIYDLFGNSRSKKSCAGMVGISVCYALCGFAVASCVNTNFLDILYCMPLLLYGIRRLIGTGKWIFLAYIYAYSFISNFYMGYMAGIFSFLFFVASILMLRWRKGKISVHILHYIFAVFSGVILSAPVTAPVIEYLIRAGRSLSDEGTFAMPSFFAVLSNLMMGQYQGTDWPVPLVFCGTGAVLLTVLFFADNANSRTEKILAATALLGLTGFTYVRPLYSLIHGFSYPHGFGFRFAWMYSFVMCTIAAKELSVIADKGIDSSRQKVILISTAAVAGFYPCLSLVIAASGKIQSSFSSVKMFIVWVIAVAWLLYLLKGANLKKYIIVVLAATEMILNGILMIMAMPVDYFPGEKQIWEIFRNKGHEVSEQVTGDFNRVCDPSWAAVNDEGALFGFNTIGIFSSVENRNLMHTLSALGFAVSGRTIESAGVTDFTKMIFDIGYDVYPGYKPGEDPAAYLVDKNEKTLPVGFLVSDEILTFNTTCIDPFKNMNDLASAMTGEKEVLYKPVNDAVTECINTSVNPGEDGALQISATGAAADSLNCVRYTVPTVNDDTYFYITPYGYKGADDSQNDLLSPVITTGKGTGGRVDYSNVLTRPAIIPVSPDDSGVNNVTITFRGNGYEAVNTTHPMIYRCDKEALKTIYDKLALNGMNDVSADENTISGTVNVTEENKVLFISVPYSPYWRVEVDGEMTDTLKVINGTFIAVSLPAGEHRILLQYKNDVFAFGVLCSVAICLVLIGFTIKNTYFTERKKI